MWDITWLPGPAKGIYFYLYLILDLFSRKIVAWDIWLEESSENASALVRRTLSEHRSMHSQPLVLHSDNGSPMKGASLLETLYALGITPSKRRPRVSNDNPYAESVFRTCKYRPSYPAGGFGDLSGARTWALSFVHWYNFEHRHSVLNFLTPHQRHTGFSKEIIERRKQVYEQARTLLNQARAVENLSYIISCSCAGSSKGNAFAGHSMVIDPWGTVVARASDGGHYFASGD